MGRMEWRELCSMRDDENCSDGNTLSTDTNTSHNKGPNESGEVAGNAAVGRGAEEPKASVEEEICMYPRASSTLLFLKPRAKLQFLCVAAAAAAGASIYVCMFM